MGNYKLSYPGEEIDTLLGKAQLDVSTNALQGLTETQKINARDNIGAISSSTVGALGDLVTTSKTNIVSAINEVKNQIENFEPNNYYITECNKLSDSSFFIKSSNGTNTVTNIWTISTQNNKTIFTNTTSGKTISFDGWE